VKNQIKVIEIVVTIENNTKLLFKKILVFLLLIPVFEYR